MHRAGRRSNRILCIATLCALVAVGCESPLQWGSDPDGTPTDGGARGPDARLPTTDSGNTPDGSSAGFTYELPDTGSVESHFAELIGPHLVEEMWQDGRGWRRTVPLADTGGEPDWSQAAEWVGPLNPEILIGTGFIDANSGFLTGAGQFHEGIWRNDQGWHRPLDIIANEPAWDADPDWSGPVDIGDFPGTGPISALSSVVMGNELLFQEQWRSGVANYHTVPLDGDGSPDWDLASEWTAWRNHDSVPGAGPVQAMSAYKLADDRIQELMWRDNKAWLRTTPPGPDAGPDWSQSGDWIESL